MSSGVGGLPLPVRDAIRPRSRIFEFLKADNNLVSCKGIHVDGFRGGLDAGRGVYGDIDWDFSRVRSKMAIDKILGEGGEGIVTIQQPTNSAPPIRAVVFLDYRRIVVIDRPSWAVAILSLISYILMLNWE